MIPMKDNGVLLAGVEQPQLRPWEPFAGPVMEFLEQLSGRIREKRRGHEELAAFGFWCRKSHMEEFRKRYEDGLPRLGRGRVFHIPASNVPLLFAYSLVMGLLAGNSCLVRVSDEIREQDRILCGILEELLACPEQEAMRKRISVFSCPRDSSLVREGVETCDGCVVWGGDRTIRQIRSIPMRADAVQLCFPDRYSVCILDTESMSSMKEEEWNRLLDRFYNDTYAMDQNACTSPGLIIWNQKEETKETRLLRERWWKGVSQKAGSYQLDAHKVMVKYERLCRYAMLSEDEVKITCRENRLYTISLPRIPERTDQIRGVFGLFFEYAGDWREAVEKMDSSRLQTVTCYGIRQEAVAEFVIKKHLLGVHRIAAAGHGADMDLIWDGQDVITMLSRLIGREVEDVAVS